MNLPKFYRASSVSWLPPTGNFTVGERVRFLLTSCVKQTNERSEWVCFTQRVNKNRTSELTVKLLIYYIHTEIHKRTELKDKHVFIFFPKKTTRGQAASQFESCFGRKLLYI